MCVCVAVLLLGSPEHRGGLEVRRGGARAGEQASDEERDQGEEAEDQEEADETGDGQDRQGGRSVQCRHPSVRTLKNYQAPLLLKNISIIKQVSSLKSPQFTFISQFFTTKFLFLHFVLYSKLGLDYQHLGYFCRRLVGSRIVGQEFTHQRGPTAR